MSPLLYQLSYTATRTGRHPTTALRSEPSRRRSVRR